MSHSTPEDNTLRAFARLLRSSEPDVVGLEDSSISEKEKTLLQQFSSGQCNEAEVEDTCYYLQDNPRLISELVQMVKNNRPKKK